MTHRSGEGETAAAENLQQVARRRCNSDVRCSNAVFAARMVSRHWPSGQDIPFNIGTTAQYVASLVEIPFPSAFDKLSLGTAQTGGSLIKSTAVPGSFILPRTQGRTLLFGSWSREGRILASPSPRSRAPRYRPVAEPDVADDGAGALLVGFVESCGPAWESIRRWPKPSAGYRPRAASIDAAGSVYVDWLASQSRCRRCNALRIGYHDRRRVNA